MSRRYGLHWDCIIFHLFAPNVPLAIIIWFFCFFVCAAACLHVSECLMRLLFFSTRSSHRWLPPKIEFISFFFNEKLTMLNSTTPVITHTQSHKNRNIFTWSADNTTYLYIKYVCAWFECHISLISVCCWLHNKNKRAKERKKVVLRVNGNSKATTKTTTKAINARNSKLHSMQFRLKSKKKTVDCIHKNSDTRFFHDEFCPWNGIHKSHHLCVCIHA